MQRGVTYGTSIKGQLTALVYRKSLRLSGIGRSLFPSGKVLNIVSTDLGRIELAANQINFVWTFPIWFCVTIGLLMRIIGPSGLAGVGLMVLCVPLQGFMIGRLMRIRKKSATIADDRIKLTSEILQGIRIIKFFTWESQFLSRVSNLRTSELHHVKNAAFIRAVIQSLGFAIPAIASAVTFLVYGAINPSLSPVQIFAALALFNQLRQPVMWVPVMVATLGDAVVAFGRLQEFFDAPESEFSARVDEEAKFGVEVKDGEFVWEGVGDDGNVVSAIGEVKDGGKGDDEEVKIDAEKGGPLRPTLRNINLVAPRGGITAIVGAVGAGKSSLISAMIGELKCNRGEVIFSGSVGYCTQQAWIVNASVKENILFGRPFDAKKYAEVIEASCLGPDLEIFPDGDQSEIGERGINLSGGQKQRVSLARLMYTACDIALLDDPLSAVDANVGRTIFEKGICGLLSNKTRLLVTHQLHFLSRCDWVILVQDGEILEQGTFQDLMAKGDELSRLMIAYGGEDGGETSEEEDVKKEVMVEDKTVVATSDKDVVKSGDIAKETTKKPAFEQIKQESKDTG
ncbi:hypothetical protein HDU76_009375, partial [Blyttiomyces sp. JEL0837]